MYMDLIQINEFMINLSLYFYYLLISFKLAFLSVLLLSLDITESAPSICTVS